MPELSVELDKWEQRAFGSNASLSIEVEGDVCVITGPANVIKRAVDLGFCHYVEFDGYIRAEVSDPIPHRSRQNVNAVWWDNARRKRVKNK